MNYWGFDGRDCILAVLASTILMLVTFRNEHLIASPSYTIANGLDFTIAFQRFYDYQIVGSYQSQVNDNACG